MDRTYYGGVERGERNVSVDNIERIAKGLEWTSKAITRSEKPLVREALAIAAFCCLESVTDRSTKRVPVGKSARFTESPVK